MTSRQVVVVTGASAGVGRATARRFAERGAAVALLARGEKGLAGAAEEVRAAGGTPLVVPVDMAEHKEVFAAADRVEREFGPIDTWVNVAFSSVFAPVTQISPEEYRRVTEVTYLGYVYGTKAALERMLPRDRGTIVQVGSALAYRGIPLQSAYCAAKHAIQGFHDSLRTELLHEGSNVHVTMVQLPAVNTPQFDWVLSRLPRRPQPVPPIYQPEVVARGDRVRGRPPAPARVLGRRHDGRHDDRQQARCRAARPVPGPHRLRLAADRRAGLAGAAGEPLGAGRRREPGTTSAPTAGSTTGRVRGRTSCGRRSTTGCWVRWEG